MTDAYEIVTEYRRDVETHAPEIVAGALIASSLESVASALRYLGNGDAGTSMGAIEALSVQLREGLNCIGDALDRSQIYEGK